MAETLIYVSVVLLCNAVKVVRKPRCCVLSSDLLARALGAISCIILWVIMDPVLCSCVLVGLLTRLVTVM